MAGMKTALSIEALAARHRDLFSEANPIPGTWARAKTRKVTDSIRSPRVSLGAAAKAVAAVTPAACSPSARHAS